MKQTKSDRNVVAFIWILLGILGRVVPHPANVSPMTSLALFGGTQLSRKRAFAVTILTMIVSDILLAMFEGHEIFGPWSLFTYSAFALITLAGMRLRLAPTAGRTFGFLAGSSLFFWIWTNFGTWLIPQPGLAYAHTVDGLVSCYVAALPFLGNSLVGDLAWGSALFLSFYGVRKVAPRFGLAVQGA